MVGITGFGAYVPFHRMAPGTNGWTAKTARAVANYDEDALTMAVAAAINCIGDRDRQKVDGLFFASTTSPYKERPASPTVATAADLRTEILANDFTNSLRSGTIALRSALDAVKAGSAHSVLVTAADMRVPQIRSDQDTVVGDGGAAVLVGDSGVVAEVLDCQTMTDDVLDVWRLDGENQIRSWEDRFVMEEGYLRVVPKVVSALLERNKMQAKDITRAVFYAPDARRHTEMARRLGLDAKTQVQDPLFDAVGNSGAAFALMMLAAALEEAKPGDRILLANYGNGGDALLLRVTDEIARARRGRGVKALVNSKRIIDDYQTYGKWRGLIDVAPAARRPPLPGPSASAMWREEDKNIRFYGVRCQSCGTPQYPPQRVCTICHSRDKFDPYRFSDRPGSLFTYSIDHLAPTLDPPLVVSVVDFDGGGRVLCMMTDRDADNIKVGMPVEMSFRKLFSAQGIHNYYWKCMPTRA